MKQRKDGRFQVAKVINGKKVFFYSAADTYRKAKKEIERKMLDYTEKEEKGLKFKIVAEEWLETKEAEVKPSTLKRYKPCFINAVDRFGGSFIRDISSTDISNFMTGFTNQYKSYKTVSMQKSVLSIIFDYACVKGYIQSNPCTYIKLPKNLKRNKRTMPSDEEITLIKENAETSQMGLFAFLLLHTGMRRSEAMALTLGDIDFINNTISVNKNLDYSYNTPKVSTTKTENGNRTVILLAPLKELLLKNYSSFISSDGTIKSKHKSKILFPNKNGNYMGESYYTRKWKKYCEELGIHITAHQLRHAFATMCYDANLSEKDTQELMGHSSIVLTHNIYTHIRKSRLSDAENKLNNYLNVQ